MATAPVFAAQAAAYKMNPDLALLAYQWTGEMQADTPSWVTGQHVSGSQLHVLARNGTFAANPGDWVIMEPDGVKNVVNNAVFQATYVPVKAPDQKSDDFTPAIPPDVPLVVAAPPVAATSSSSASAR